MKWILRTKEIIKNFYERYDRYLNALFRFIFALTAFMVIMMNTGYNASLTTPIFAVLLALICAFLPMKAIAVLSAVLIVMEFTSVSIEVTAIAGILFLVMLLVYFVFKPGNSWLMVFTFTCCLLGIYPLLVATALMLSPLEIIVLIFGIIVYGLVAVVKKDVSVLFVQTGGLSLGERVNLLLSDIFTSERLMLLMLALVASVLLVCAIRHTRINYSGVVAIISGDVLFLLVYLLGSYFLSVPLNYTRLGIGLFLNVLFAFIYITFVISADYRRTEIVQFEDDEYYYFVKAIPKTTIAPSERRVESITGDTEEDAFVSDFEISANNIFVRKDEEESGQEENK